MMTSLRPSATLPATPVHSSGMRAVKSPALTCSKTLNSTLGSTGSAVVAVPTGMGSLPDAGVPLSRERPGVQFLVNKVGAPGEEPECGSRQGDESGPSGRLDQADRAVAIRESSTWAEVGRAKR